MISSEFYGVNLLNKQTVDGTDWWHVMCWSCSFYWDCIFSSFTRMCCCVRPLNTKRL